MSTDVKAAFKTIYTCTVQARPVPFPPARVFVRCPPHSPLATHAGSCVAGVVAREVGAFRAFFLPKKK